MRRGGPVLAFAAILSATAACSLLVSTSDLTGGDATDGAVDAIVASDGASDASAIDAKACGAAFDSDPANCGVCGHSCQGAACAGGRCEPMLLAVSPPGHVFDMSVDETDIYFTAQDATKHGSLGRVPKTGGNLLTLIDALDDPQHVLVRGDDLYFTHFGPSAWAVRVCPKATCSAATEMIALLDGFPPDLTIAADGSMFAADWNTGAIYRCSTSSCPTTKTTISSGNPKPWGIAVDATNVYWSVNASDGAGAGSIKSCPLTGCVPGVVTLATALTSPLLLRATSKHILWDALTADVDAGGQQMIVGCESAQCGTTTFVLATGLPPFSVSMLRADERALMWNEPSHGAIKACTAPPCATGSTTLVDGRSSLAAFATDEVFVYFADANGLWRVAR